LITHNLSAAFPPEQVYITLSSSPRLEGYLHESFSLEGMSNDDVMFQLRITQIDKQARLVIAYHCYDADIASDYEEESERRRAASRFGMFLRRDNR
jgi:hypothetical protein